MTEIERLERISESIKNEIDELQSLLENSDNSLLKAKRSSFQRQLSSIISNLECANNSVYNIFEELNCNDTEQLQQDYDVLHEILEEKLSYDEKVSMRIKHGIDFNY